MGLFDQRFVRHDTMLVLDEYQQNVKFRPGQTGKPFVTVHLPGADIHCQVAGGQQIVRQILGRECRDWSSSYVDHYPVTYDFRPDSSFLSREYLS